MNSHNQQTHQQQQQQKQQQKNRQQGDSYPSITHSTHSYLETFDQATRDQQLEQENKDKMSQFNSQDEARMQSAVNPEQALQEASSGVQLDRDVQQSRRIADESKQKASGSARTGSWSGNQNELPYVE